MDNLTNELVESKRDFGMFWVAEWHKSGTSTHTHLLLKGEVTDLVDCYWKRNNYRDNRGIKHLAYDRGCHTNNIFENKGFKKLEKRKKKVYLTKEEITQLENVKLIPRLDRVRYCFL